MDLPAAYPATNFHTANLIQFAADVDKATGGKLKITVHANASLFKAPEIKRAVQGGQAQAGEILLVNFQNEWQVFGADGLPFLADSYDSAWKLYQAQKPLLEKKFGEQGMALLYTRGLATAGHLCEEADHLGRRPQGREMARLQPGDGTHRRTRRRAAVTVQAAELSQAMATGVVESYMSSGSTGFDTKTYEHIKYWYDTQAWLPKNAVIVNKAAIDALDAPTKQALLTAATEAETRGWAASKKENTDTQEKLKANGMNILPPPAQLKTDMAKVGDTMLKEWLDKAGADGKALVDAYRK